MKFRRKIAVALCLCLCLGSGTTVSHAQEIPEEQSNQLDSLPQESVETQDNEVAESETAVETAEKENTERETEMEADAEAAGEVEPPTELEGNGAFPAEEQRLQNVTGMDENGNIYPLEYEDGTIAEPTARTRAATGKIVNFNTKGVVVTNYKEVATGTDGYTCGAYGADAAYLGTSNGKVKFMLAGVIGEVNSGEVQVVDISRTKSMSYYSVKDGYLYHYITTNMNNTSYPSALNNGKAPSYLSAGVKYYSYDGHYFYTYNNYSYIQSDYNSGNRSHAVNKNNPHFNYFQYLPMRSKISYSAAQFQSIVNNSQVKNYSNSKLRDLGDDFVAAQNDFGVNALLAFGVAVNESAWGTSDIAQKKNNIFGLNAVDASPGPSANIFATTQACVRDFTDGWMSRGYLYPKDGRYFGGFLGNKASGMNVKYASDPYWGEKAANVAWSIDINNGSKEAGRYSLGIKDIVNSTSAHTALNVRKEATTASTSLYSTGKAGTYSFIILGESGGFYKVQSDPVLTSGRNGITKNTGYYNYGGMYAYTSKDYITKISEGNGGWEPDVKAEGINYSVHAQTYGWMSTRMDGQMAGTQGEAKRLEAIEISLRNPSVSGSVRYRSHVQTHGWTDWKTDGAMSGTEGQAKRMEAIQIQLTGKMADKYDIYYRVHSQTYGWLDWAKNGEMAGSADAAKRMESIEIKLVKKGGAAPGETKKTFVQPLLQYSTHAQTYGWQSTVLGGAKAGTEGEAKRLEAMKLSLENPKYAGNIEYRVHAQTHGWMSYVRNGAMAGTSGQAKRMEAIQIRLTGTMANKYDIYYRVHSQTYGWLGWAKNGQSAGTEGQAKRMEAVQIVLVAKGAEAPGSTEKCFIK